LPHREEADFWGRVLQLDDGNFHLWHGVTPAGGTEIDVLLLDAAEGAFCIDVKGLDLLHVKHLDLQLVERPDGSACPSPFEQAHRAVRALGAALDKSWETRPNLIPVAAFPKISRAEWIEKFKDGPMAASADRCLLKDDLEDTATFRLRLNSIATNPLNGRPRGLAFSGLAEEDPFRMNRLVHAGAPSPAVNPEFLFDESQSPVLSLLDEVIALVDGPGTVFSSPGSEALKRWRDAVLAERARLRVSVVGEFKAGKSTLINAILRREACYVDEFEATTVGTTYTDGGFEGVAVEFDDRVEHWTLQTFLNRCSMRDMGGVRRVTVTLPTGLPFDISDTPGLGSFTEAHGDEAEAEIRRAEMLLWAVDANDAGSAREGAFIQRAREIGLPLIVLLTKSDVLSAGEADELIAYVAGETGVAKCDIIPLSALDHLNGGDPGVERLLERLAVASEGRSQIQSDAHSAKLKEVLDGARSILLFLNERNAPHARFLAAERGYLETSASGISQAAKGEWLRVLREECSEVAKSPEILAAEDAEALEAALRTGLTAAVDRATARFLKSLHRLVRDEWRGALEQRSLDFAKRLADLLKSRPDATADLEFLESQRDAFQSRAEVISTESDSTTTENRLLVVGFGAAASLLTASLLPLAIAGVVAVFATRQLMGSDAKSQSLDPVIGVRIQDALISSFESVADSIEQAIDRIVAEVAIRSLIKLVDARGGPDFQAILVIEQKAGDLLDELAALERG
jgi:hypothetical protein